MDESGGQAVRYVRPADSEGNGANHVGQTLCPPVKAAPQITVWLYWSRQLAGQRS